MVLADTSVWISHLHRPDERLENLLDERRVFGHPLVIGELACGALPRRSELLTFLGRLPAAKAATHDEVLDLIERMELWGVGLSYIDVHLLASALITGIPLWAEDRHLRAATEALGVAYE